MADLQVQNIARTTAWAQDVMRQAGGFRRLEHNGVAIDNTGVANVTTAVQNSINTAITNGDPLWIDRGSYNTSSAAITADLTAGNLVMRGNGGTFLGPTTLDTFIAKGTAFGSPKGFIDGVNFSSISATITANGKAALVVQSAPHFAVYNSFQARKHIGIYVKGNSYNASFFNVGAPRNNQCLVGVYLPEGSQSGSDIYFYNLTTSNFRAAIVMKGGGGGYKFFGGQIGTTNTTGSANDNRGVIMSGFDEIAQVASGAMIDAGFYGVSMEGSPDVWNIRSWGETHMHFWGTHFLSLAGTHKCLGLIKATEIARGKIGFHSCNIGGNYAATTRAGLGVITGAAAGHSNLQEENWYVSPQAIICASGGGTHTQYKGVAVEGGYQGSGFYDGQVIVADAAADNSSLLRANSGVLEISNNAGTSYAPV